MHKKVKEYINSRIRQEQEESGKWIDIVLNSESKEEAQKAYNEYLKKKCGYDRWWTEPEDGKGDLKKGHPPTQA